MQFVDSQRFPEVPAGPGHFYVLESPDLIHWSEPRVCFEKGSFWADRDYWAPECHIWQGKYYLISSFRAEGTYRRCQCLVSESPRGPFRPVREKPLTPEGWHCPNEHSRKRILLFEMEETADALHIVNEVTGNWYHAIGGRGKRYAYKTPCKEPPCFSCNPGKEETGDGSPA